MTGTLSTMTNINGITAFNFYSSSTEEGTVVTKVPITKIEFNDLTNYHRRVLFYPYLPRDRETPFAVAVYDVFNVIKVFVPKGIDRIVPINREDEEYPETEGRFNDPSDSSSMFQYNTDKYVVLLESSLGEDLENFFIQLHEASNYDAHREDYELIYGNLQKESLAPKWAIESVLRDKTVDLINTVLISSDDSMVSLGDPINYFKWKDTYDMPYLPTGTSAFNFFLDTDMSMHYLGDSIISGRVNPVYPSNKHYFRTWAPDSVSESDPEKHLLWDEFIWAADGYDDPTITGGGGGN